MKRLGGVGLFVSFLAVGGLGACGGSRPASTTGNESSDTGPVRDTRSELVKRRDTACEQLGPRLTTCAVDDARAALAAGTITQQQYDADTSPELQRALTADFLKKCQVDLSSRQVRVLEVCHKEEAECAPLVDCLDNLNDSAK